MTIEAHESFFKELLPGIESNVRNHEMLEPVAILKLMDGRKSIASMQKFFQPGMKDAVVPMVNVLLQNENVAMVAVISECWIAEMGPEEAKELGGQSLEDHERRVDEVVVSVYGRDRRDTIFSLKVKSGRTGVEEHGNFSGASSEGRFVRDNPENN